MMVWLSVVFTSEYALFVPRRASLGFGTEFFELLDRSNNRKEEVRRVETEFCVLESTTKKIGPEVARKLG